MDYGIRPTWEASLQFNGLTASTTGCGTACSNIPFSGVLPYAFDTLPSNGDWALSGTIGCNSCNDGFSTTLACQYWLVALLRCTSDMVRLQAELALQASSTLYYRPYNTNYEWSIIYQDDIPLADFQLGVSVDIPRLSTNVNYGDCLPTGISTSTCAITFSVA